MRVSRVHPGKTYAYVYDFIYDHGMFFSQFWKSQNIEYRECRFNVEKECTNYNNEKVWNFIKSMSDYFYFDRDIDMAKIDINDLGNTLSTGNVIVIQ